MLKFLDTVCQQGQPLVDVVVQLAGDPASLFLMRFDQLLAADPRNEGALRLRAVSLFALGRFAESNADMDALIRLKPNDAPLLATRGMTRLGLKQLDQAVADFNRAIGLDPNNAAAYLGRGMVDLTAADDAGEAYG